MPSIQFCELLWWAITEPVAKQALEPSGGRNFQLSGRTLISKRAKNLTERGLQVSEAGCRGRIA